MPARLTKEKWRRIPIYCGQKNTFAKKRILSPRTDSPHSRDTGKTDTPKKKKTESVPLFSPSSHRGTTYGFPEKKGKALESNKY